MSLTISGDTPNFSAATITTGTVTTLTTTTISDGTNSTSSTNAIQGSAKAWVRFNGVPTLSIGASYNVSSVTRTAAGTYTIVMTNALTDTNYCVVGTCRYPGNYNGIGQLEAATSTTQFTYLSINANGLTATDMTLNSVAVFRQEIKWHK